MNYCRNAITSHCMYPPPQETKGSFNAATFAKMKKGARLLNYARADLVNVADLKAALEDGTLSHYAVDHLLPKMLLGNEQDYRNALHLGASSPESQVNCCSYGGGRIKGFLRAGQYL